MTEYDDEPAPPRHPQISRRVVVIGLIVAFVLGAAVAAVILASTHKSSAPKLVPVATSSAPSVPSSTPAPSSSSPSVPPEQAYLSAMRARFPGVGDEVFTMQANLTCKGFGLGETFAQQAAIAMRTESLADATFAISAAVFNYCPQYVGLLPPA